MAQANSNVCSFLSNQTWTKSNATVRVCWSWHLLLRSITSLYLSRPPPLSLCLCPLPTAVVSGFHNGSQDALWLCGAVRRKGMYECDFACVRVCVWAVRSDAVISTHERFSISSLRQSEALQRHLHIYSLGHTLANIRETTQIGEIHALYMLELESAACYFIVFENTTKWKQFASFYSLHFPSISAGLMEWYTSKGSNVSCTEILCLVHTHQVPLYCG